MLDSISFVGGGVMGEAMIQGLLSKSLVKANEITVGEPRKDRSKELQQRYDVKITSDNRRAAQASKIIVFRLNPRIWDR